MIRFTIEEENLLAILPEELDTKQALFELDRLYHIEEEDDEMQNLILQCRLKIEDMQDGKMEQYPLCVAEDIS